MPTTGASVASCIAQAYHNTLGGGSASLALSRWHAFGVHNRYMRLHTAYYVGSKGSHLKTVMAEQDAKHLLWQHEQPSPILHDGLPEMQQRNGSRPGEQALIAC